MDPDECLRMITSHIICATAARKAGQFGEASLEMRHAARIKADLIGWLCKGGYEPDWGHYPRASAYVMRSMSFYRGNEFPKF